MWYSVGSTIYMFGLWAITYLVLIVSGPANSGILSVAMAITNVCYTIAVWGMRSYQVSDIDGRFSDNTYIMSRLITCIVSVAACAVFVFVKDYSYEKRLCFILYMIFKVSEAGADVFNGIVQKHWRMDIIGKSYIARAALTVAAFTLTLKFTGSLPLAILSMMVGSFAVIIFYDVIQTVKISHVQIKWDFQSTHKLLIQCAPLVICSFLYTFNALIPRLLLEEKFGDTIQGFYAAIASPVLIVQLLASYIYSPLIPLFSKSHADHNTSAFSRLLIKILLLILALSVVSIFVCYLFGDWGLSIIFVSQKKSGLFGYFNILIPTMLTAIGTSLIWLLNGVITAIRQIKSLFFIAFAGSIVCVVITKYFVYKYGANGINISMIIVQAVQIVLMMSLVIRYIQKGKSNPINK